MNENKKGYWVYSIFTIGFFIALFGFLAYLIYDLIIKLAEKDFSNNTVVQALITLIITVFIGGYFSKYLERRNSIKLELSKIRNEIALRIVDYSSMLIHHPDNEEIQNLLIAESSKVKLYFDDETLKKLNEFIECDDKKICYNPLINQLKNALNKTK